MVDHLIEYTSMEAKEDLDNRNEHRESGRDYILTSNSSVPDNNIYNKLVLLVATQAKISNVEFNNT